MGISSLFFKDEPEAQKTEVQKTVEKAQDTQSKPGFVFSPNPTNVGNTISNTNGVPDEKFVSMLENVIAENNIPGLDYFEFKKIIEKMQSLPMDEATKFLSAYSTFEVQGITKESLLSSIDKYVSLINKEQETFDSEMAVSYKEKVENKKIDIEKSQLQIVELNNKIVELNNFIMSTTQETQQEEMKLRLADANFKQSAQRVISNMENDKQKLINYIK